MQNSGSCLLGVFVVAACPFTEGRWSIYAFIALQQLSRVLYRFSISSRKVSNMPLPMGITVQSVVIGDYVYVGGGGTEFDNLRYKNESNENNFIVMQYEQSRNEWTKLNKHTQQFFAMISHEGNLVLVGGCDYNHNATGKIFVFTPGQNRSEDDHGCWSSDQFPSLKHSRFSATAVCYKLKEKDYIVVVGGYAKNGSDEYRRFSSVEVLEIEGSSTSGWYCDEDSLPLPRSSMKSALGLDLVNDNTLYLMGGKDHKYKTQTQRQSTRVVYKIKIDNLIKSTTGENPTKTQWEPIGNTPLDHSTPICIGNYLLAIGGRDSTDPHNPSRSIFVYRDTLRRWDEVGKLLTARFFSACSVLQNKEGKTEMIVAGGENGHDNIDDVEILSVDTDRLSSYLVLY